jgi:DHA1 family multidrug resistance protein-like MFS transporter
MDTDGTMNPSATSWQRTLTIVFGAQLITAVGFSSMFPFLPLYVHELGSVTGSSEELLTGLVFSAQAFTMMIASPLWGGLADRHGRKLMVERAMFGGALVLFLMAFARSAEELVVLRAVQGTVTGTIGASNALVAAVVPRDRTGFAMGLLHMAMGAGVALGPVIGGVIADVFGYAAAFYVTAVLLFIAGLMVWLGVHEDFTPPTRDGRPSLQWLAHWRSILAVPPVLATYGLRFINQLGRMVFLPVLPLFIQTLPLSSVGVNTYTGLVVGISSASTTLSTVYLGRLGDRTSHRQVLLACTLFSFVLYSVQSLVNEGWQLLVGQALAGVALGGIVPAVSALLAHYTLSGDEGTVYGLDNAITSGARAVAPLLGVGVAAAWGLRSVFVTAALLYLAATVLAGWGLPQREDKGSERLA